MNIFFKAVSEGRPEAALLSLFNMAESRLAFIKYVLSEEDEEFHPSCRTLALSIWNNENMYWTGYNSSRIDNPNLALYSDVFNAKLQEYQRLWQNYKDFLSSPLTVAFLREELQRSQISTISPAEMPSTWRWITKGTGKNTCAIVALPK